MPASKDIIVRISASQRWWDLDWSGLAHYQDLMWLLVKRDFVSKYKQTVLGPLWMIIQPLATTLVFTVIFSRVAQLSTDGIPAPLFYLSGLIGWNLFSGILGSTGNVLQANAGLFGKVYFPRLIVPFANTISALIPFAIQLGMFFVMLFFYPGAGIATGAEVSTVFLRAVTALMFILQIMVAGLGCGLLFSSLTAVYRDLQHALSFIVQIWMYLTPVIYPLSQFPDKWRWVAQMNPLATPVEGLRAAFLGGGTFSIPFLVASWGISLSLLLIGAGVYNRAEKSFIDRA